MADKEIKSCPCCGEDMARVINDNDFFRVRCDYCGLQTEVNYKDEEGAIDSWNTRPNPWHTGKPTEEGWYLLNLKKDYKPYCVAYMDGRHWLGIDDFFILVDDVKAWMPIEPFKED